MTDVEAVREGARAALAALEASRQRIDDLNVYPVPDGDTGTNLTLTMRSVVEALDGLEDDERLTSSTLAREVTRAALMGARGNSGVILSQIVRGAADVLGEAERVDAATLARSLRGASDAAYRAVRRPVEGTMLTVIRELAEEAEPKAAGLSVVELLQDVVRRGEDAVARTQDLLDVLREAGVVDAGGAGLLEIVRGIAAWAAGEPLPEPVPHEELGVDAIHQELSRYRYCTVFLVEGNELDHDALERELERLGDSLLVVGDRNALRVHLHTDDPGVALSAGTALGVLENVEIANMHAQTEQRERRLLQAVPDAPAAASAVIAVALGEGNRALFESLGAVEVIEGGQTMNPSVGDLAAAIAGQETDVIVLPNNPNVLLAAEHAAFSTHVNATVLPTRSIPEGLAAMVAFDAARTAEENANEMRAAVEGVVTGEVTVASRDAELNGVRVRKGQYFGLADGEAVAVGEVFEPVAAAVVDRLLAEPRDVLTLLTGEEEPDLEGLMANIVAKHPTVEVDVQAGGQPHYPLLLSAE
jgi:DAK2 domain fusion protein YloV